MKLKRGQRYAGGIFVGTTPAGVEWVARKTPRLTEAGAFMLLCERFDLLFGGAR